MYMYLINPGHFASWVTSPRGDEGCTERSSTQLRSPSVTFSFGCLHSPSTCRKGHTMLTADPVTLNLWHGPAGILPQWPRPHVVSNLTNVFYLCSVLRSYTTPSHWWGMGKDANAVVSMLHPFSKYMGLASVMSTSMQTTVVVKIKITSW